ncbi:MAG TPA: hypothetical protein EYM95_22735 [Candidatus Obscuribacterales bacterium]|nr:hypothetical protein [Candidatus Obscuribacterales bacterium]
MNWRLAGLGGGFLAFFAVNIFISAFIVQGFVETFVPGAIAAWFTWKWCTDKEKAELMKLLNPPEETWQVPLPVAWGTIRDVLDTSKVHTGTGGTSGWRVQKEDDSRGIIQAQLSFSEQVGGITNAQVLPRTVEIQAFLKADGGTTKVETHYQVFSPMNFEKVRMIVTETQKELSAAAERNKGG